MDLKIVQVWVASIGLFFPACSVAVVWLPRPVETPVMRGGASCVGCYCYGKRPDRMNPAFETSR